MKRLFCFMLISFSLLSFSVLNFEKQLPKEFMSSEIQVFCSDKNNNRLNYKKIENGNGEVYFAKFKDKNNLLYTLKSIEGITYIFNGNINDYRNLMTKLKIKSIEQNDNSCVGFSDYFNRETFYYGKKVNVQMCFNNDKIYVGTPLILGCY